MNYQIFRKWNFINLLFGVLITFAPSFVFADERIKLFVSDIVVREDSSLKVTETITVRAEGQNIRRGIYREFPTKYEIQGRRYAVGFNLLSVKRDGQNESYHTEDLSNGVRIYMGRSDYFLPVGEYTYEITYITDRQLTHLDTMDELYWSVTGNGWDFPIDKVVANVYLPNGAEVLQSIGYTGYFGDDGEDYQSTNGVSFATTRTLSASEGLTIAIGWPTGFVSVPDSYEQMQYYLEINASFLIGLVTLVIITVYYSVVWFYAGRDPAAGIVIPLFDGPKNLSPAAAGYLSNLGFRKGYSENTAFVVALTSLATKGYITIDQSKSDYSLKRTAKRDLDSLPRGEWTIIDRLLPDPEDEYKLKQKYDSRFASVVDFFKEAVSDEYGSGYFAANTGKWLIGFLLGLSGIILSLAYAGGDLIVPALFFMAFFGIFSGVILPPLCRVLSYKMMKSGLPKNLAALLPLTIFLVIPYCSLSVGELITEQAFSAENYSVILLIVTVTLVFSYLMEAPSIKGRKILDQLEGYKLYLSVAEGERLEAIGPEPDFNEHVFEQHLPFAMALGVEDQWSQRLQSYLTVMNQVPMDYKPRWYSGDSFSRSSSSIASSLTSGIGHTISSASSPPSSSSSSSSSGGGSSGGGGGGGGGGGW
ncbi:hypothetical protein WH96_10665 [Kiloniella spongiae]|uniref:Transmembrane signal peptide protein n=1 Tax=Kiloniella spongiae TaxID=1489064 RepID=A0A0H2MW50_9PROT|nr:DUF2207 domain-containing protein [Kiloniella spongiae]KLN60905.1 hypothetical protein WH96_10665 [Kiloniella spongiae]